MKLFLCGGGSGEKTKKAMKKFSQVIDKNKPLLYVPLAMNKDRYPSCLEWITREVKDINIKNIEMVCSANELANKTYKDYCAIFIGGGNTYKLLDDIKRSGAYNKIKEYIKNGGVIFGGSAGAIIFGKDIDTCKYEDDNESIKLKDTQGFNVLKDYSLLCHYNKKKEQTDINSSYLTSYSKDNKVIYLPEGNTIFINNNQIQIIGNEKYCSFIKGNANIIDPMKMDIKKVLDSK